MENCAILCEEENIQGCLLERSDTVVDACNSPFVYGGVSYDNLLDYCQQVSPEVDSWSACETSVSGTSQTCSHPRTPVSTATTVAAMALEGREKAESVFGPGGFSFKLVGFEPTFSCEPQAGQSYLSNLLGLVEDTSQVFPICEDYAGTLSQVLDFATGLVQNEYQLKLGVDESLDAVHIVSDDGTTRDLGPAEYTYDPATGLLHIEKSSLRATDQEVALDVGRDCIIR